MKSIRIIVLFFLIVILISCEKKIDRAWYDSENDAIEQELSNMGLIEVQRLSLEGETLVLYKLNNANAVGVASVTQSDKGYSWYQGISPFSIDFLQLEYQSESNKYFFLTIVRGEQSSQEIILNAISFATNDPITYKFELNNGYYFSADIEKLKNVSIEE